MSVIGNRTNYSGGCAKTRELFHIFLQIYQKLKQIILIFESISYIFAKTYCIYKFYSIFIFYNIILELYDFSP